MTPPSEPHVNLLIDDLSRHQSAKMISVLTRILGFRNVEISEEIVQETLLKAFQLWSYRGVPPNPQAWLMVTAKNKAIDYIRRERNALRIDGHMQVLLRSEWTLVSTVEQEFEESRVRDDLLRMVFACCDPRLTEPDQIALTLKFACGFSLPEIAAALLASEETVRKRLYRARQRLKRTGELLFVATESDLVPRLDSVLQVVYLVFSEGYKSNDGEAVVRQDVCVEATRLVGMLLHSPVCDKPKTHALLALMLFHAARFSSRTYEDGSICQLQHQDRSAWDQAVIAEAYRELDRSAAGDELSRYHVEAAIAAAHCSAVSFEETDWKSIAGLYDRLVAIYDTPITRLNRAIARGFAEGAGAAIHELDRLSASEDLGNYYLYHAAVAEFAMRLGNRDHAGNHYEKALALCRSEPERRLLQEKLRRCSAESDPSTPR